TSRAGSNMPCSRIQRRRARATSARFCSAAYRVFLKLMLRRAKNRHTALRLPAIRRLRIAATISSSVRSGWLAIRPQKLRLLLQWGDAAAASLCRNAAGLLETLHPDDHDAGADSIAFGRLAPRGTGLHIFNHSGTQVDGIGLRHRSLQKKRINAGRLAH